MTDQPSATPPARIAVRGPAVDDQTRCVHYHGPTDVVAIQFRCCREFYPCHLCHAASVDHPVERWPVAEYAEPAVLCGVCRSTFSISDYLTTTTCLSCGAGFNERCALHHHLYFAG